ncbi:hypothetical protein, partial [Microseira sp. BLCC-F43]|uniref:hypothetical protein n=1 Tax=Microseira sp. BLCC-F43 TaxID=3153602 RepID=UPI0035BB6F7C
GERIQAGIETPSEFRRLKSSISVGVLDPWDCRPRVAALPCHRVFFDKGENEPAIVGFRTSTQPTLVDMLPIHPSKSTRSSTSKGISNASASCSSPTYLMYVQHYAAQCALALLDFAVVAPHVRSQPQPSRQKTPSPLPTALPANALWDWS